MSPPIRLYLISARDQTPPEPSKPIHCVVVEAYTAADARTQWNVLLKSGCHPSTIEHQPLYIEPISPLDERLDEWRDDEHSEWMREGARPMWHETRTTPW